MNFCGMHRGSHCLRCEQCRARLAVLRAGGAVSKVHSLRYGAELSGGMRIPLRLRDGSMSRGHARVDRLPREAARRLGVSDTAMHKAERAGRIAREPDGQWDIDRTRRRLTETADPARSPLASSTGAEGTPFARLKVAQLALRWRRSGSRWTRPSAD